VRFVPVASGEPSKEPDDVADAPGAWHFSLSIPGILLM
jgi:hypothetical protein